MKSLFCLSFDWKLHFLAWQTVQFLKICLKMASLNVLSFTSLFKDKMRQIGIFDPLRVKNAWRPGFFFFLLESGKTCRCAMPTYFQLVLKKQIRPIILNYKRLSSSCNEGPYGVHILGLPTHDFSWRGLRQMLEEWMQTKKGQVNL